MMKLKLVVVDLELTRRQKLYGALGIGGAAALFTSVALADVPVVFMANAPLTAKSLNDNFASLDARAKAIEDDIANGVPLAAQAQSATTAQTATVATKAQGADAGQFNVPGTLGLGLTFAHSGDCAYNSANGYTDCVCPVGTIAIGGGAYITGPNSLQESRNNGDDNLVFGRGWRVACVNASGSRVPCSVPRAYCARIAPMP
jgi:hypothetical protein